MTVNYFEEDIRNVTDTYYYVMLSALRREGVNLVKFEKASFKIALKIKHGDYILATSLIGFLKLWLCGHRNFIYWFQGITPEEDFMITGSSFRYFVHSKIERLVLKTAKYKLGVSKYLFLHYEKKYGLSIPLNTVYIMPCFNSDFHKDSFYKEGKYTRNTFCFAGGMQVWQGFESIVKLYKKIEGKFPDSFLKIYSKDKDQAYNILIKYDIKNYMIDCVPQEKMEEVLSDCKFGFILRDNDIINNVATPTKLGTYIANGIIPVFTPTIYAFADLCQKYKYLCCAEEDKLLNEIEPFMSGNLSREEILKEYSDLYNTYYNKEKHIESLRKYFNIRSL